ncbi:bacteriophage Gp15 family protein [Carnobacterium maltaromaticum]|uniref:bacteriophage Gp15 family protein n=1 Tax=Carnobacterium maltaromaticum TaxID=2751 RepID=UPI000704A448|nr:bacteriophage Gp15 family protein [Carnobacterium maltaromaticum]CRH18737.1 Bacteriophage Gp15 family protein [Carnobacterium maltaromaticum]
MFSLAYGLDDSVEIDNKTYKVNMAFDNILRFMDMLEDEDFSSEEKVLSGVEILLGKALNYDTETQYEIFNQLIENFISTNDGIEIETDRNGDPMPVPVEDEIYSLKHDAEYIFSSFKQTYDIDLIEVQGKLHWSKFRAYLSGLPDNTKFKEVIDIRQRELPSGKGSSKERAQLIKLKNYYALPGQIVEDGEEE